MPVRAFCALSHISDACPVHCLWTMQIPASWRDAIAQHLHGVSRTALAERAARISHLYRDGEGSGFAVRDAADALAYALTRSPATYGAVRHALERLRERAPGFTPSAALDLGAGAGAASWAIAGLWPEIESITQADRNGPLLELGKKLVEHAPAAALREARQVCGDLTRSYELPAAELVVISYMLGELTPEQMERVVAKAWEQSTGALVVVEPGTPAGYRRILQVRAYLLAHEARIAAPCPHEHGCPVAAPDWCHFAQRVERSRDHRLLKGAELPYEDEKFSYLAAVRPALFTQAEGGRILARPEKEAAFIQVKLCGANGALERIRVARREKDSYKRAKKKEWGDEF